MTPDGPSRSGVEGALRLAAVLAVLVLAALAALLVLEVIPREAVGEAAGKLLMIAAIAVVAVLAIWPLVSGRGRRAPEE